MNKKAFHNFEIEDRLEAGMELLGSEVKSLRIGTGGPHRLIRENRKRRMLACRAQKSPSISRRD